jgi:hypothetical protein
MVSFKRLIYAFDPCRSASLLFLPVAFVGARLAARPA